MHCACAVSTACSALLNSNAMSTARKTRPTPGRTTPRVLNLSSLVAFTGVAEDSNNSLSAVHSFGDPHSSAHVGARRRPDAKPLFAKQPRHHAIGFRVRDGQH